MLKLSKRYKIILNYVVGPVLFILLSISIYRRIQHQQNLHDSWSVIRSSLTGKESWKLILVGVLSIANWGLETRKWQILVRPIENISYGKAFKSVLSGLSLSLFLPNRLGEYFGRMAFMAEGNRLRSIPLSIIGSISQLIVTLIAGVLGIFYLKTYILENHYEFLGVPVFWFNLTLALVIIGTILLLTAYYKFASIARWIERTKYGHRVKFFIEHVEDFDKTVLTRILSLSFLRYSVFIVQYILLMQVFDVNIPWLDAAWLTCSMFLVLAIVPSLPIAEIGLRGQVSLQLFGMLSTNVLGIVATAAGIWLINLIVPAIVGSLFILSVKLFGKEHG
jgi:hypothetical protein